MSISAEKTEALAVDVSCTNDSLSATLADGRVISVPLAWFPRLLRASAKQRADWEFIGGGIGIHWEAIDEDISVASLLQPENFMRLPDRASHAKARPVSEGKRSTRPRRSA
jgi:hypothetical protein